MKSAQWAQATTVVSDPTQPACPAAPPFTAEYSRTPGATAPGSAMAADGGTATRWHLPTPIRLTTERRAVFDARGYVRTGWWAGRGTTTTHPARRRAEFGSSTGSLGCLDRQRASPATGWVRGRRHLVLPQSRHRQDGDEGGSRTAVPGTTSKATLAVPWPRTDCAWRTFSEAGRLIQLGRF